MIGSYLYISTMEDITNFCMFNLTISKKIYN